MTYKIIGKIVGKARPRTNFKTGIIYTPSNTKKYERLIKKYIDTKVNGAITIDLECHFSMAKGLSKKKRFELLGKPCLKKPDIDNITKIYLDALNGVAYEDDKQVYKINCTKIWDNEEYVLLMIKGQNDIIK